mgnify:CR=1 FL=1
MMSELEIKQAQKIGLMILAEDVNSPLPLEHTCYTGMINGRIATFKVQQRFGNPLQEPAELEYLFPLPHEAMISGFEIHIGDRLIKGEIEEVEKARKSYQEALEEGKQGGLLEERRPNLFSVKLGNVMPQQTILADVCYHQRIHFDENQFEIVIPMGITPKYSSAEDADEAQDINPPLAGEEEKIGTVEIDLSIDSGVAVSEPVSPSHSLITKRLDERRLHISLAETDIPNRDFVLRYVCVNQKPEVHCWISKENGGSLFFASLVPPASNHLPEPGKREFIFVLDRSGSMSGEPIAQARNALRASLRSLNPGDRFYLLLFDDQLEWYKTEPELICQESIDRCDQFLNTVEGRGGTEIVQALEAALSIPAHKNWMRYLVFLTDGAVSSESRALTMIQKKLGGARVFTFGIGSSVNRALLSRMASAGRGAAEFLQLDEDIEGAIIRFQDRVSYPVLTDLRVITESGKTWDVYPSVLPDLYAGQCLELCGWYHSSENQPVRMVIEGKRGSEKLKLGILLTVPTETDPAFARIWAKVKSDDLQEQAALNKISIHQARKEIIALAMDYQMVTPYTAFVAIDHELVAKGRNPRKLRVSHPLPYGVNREAFEPLLMQGVYKNVNFLTASYMAGAPAPAGDAEDTMLYSPPMHAPLGMPVEEAFMRISGQETQLDTPLSAKRMEFSKTDNKKDRLRWLMRNQALNGSWDDNMEKTAAALLAFTRAGYSPHHGPYKKTISRAYRWILHAQGEGFLAFLRALVVYECAKLTGLASYHKDSREIISSLPEPASPLDSACLNRINGFPFAIPEGLSRLDELRLKAIDGSVSEKNFEDIKNQEVAQFWLSV